MTDPFASASASAAGNATAATDPFGQKPSEVKTSDYPSIEELYGKLIVIQPSKLERGLPNKFDSEKPRDRLTADVTVINVDNPKASETYRDMYFSQGAIIGQTKNLIDTKGMLLGTLRRHRAPQTPDGINTPDEVEAGLAKNPRMSFAWKLSDFTEDEKAKALEWYRSK
jgi:hypothetical protein